MKVRGVNLGNWFCLEKWMKPELFDGCDEWDEYGLIKALPEESQKRLRDHYETYITEKDIAFLAQSGVNLLRIPISFAIFGDVEGRIGYVEFLDRAFDWAEKYDMQILIDLHSVRGGQNGFDNSGYCMLCTWHLHPEYVEETYTLLERVVKRYAERKAFFGIEPLNEPASDGILEGNKGRYSQKYPERVALSEPIPDEFIYKFYLEVYKRLKPIMPENKVIVLSDQFDLGKWDNFMPADQYPGVWLDTHKYICFSEGAIEDGGGYAVMEESTSGDNSLLNSPKPEEGSETGSGYTTTEGNALHDNSLKNYLRFIEDVFKSDVQRAAQFHPVMVGEWCLVNNMKAIKDTVSLGEKAKYYRALADAQIAAWETCEGGAYWSYRVDGENEDRAWDFCECVKNGWLTYNL